MSTIKIKGQATRKVYADTIKYRLSFYSKDQKASKAAERTREQCEIFLKDMKEYGFDISKFQLESDEISKEYNSEEKKATRTLIILTDFDPKINNAIFNIIQKEDLTVETKTDYYLSYLDELHKELMQEALLDSRNKAELIASSNNQKVKYASLISEYRDDLWGEDDVAYRKCGIVRGILLDDESYSSQLCAKEIEHTATLFVEWEIE